ncbi:AzlC family ABC transporter permease [Natronospora cellulosivora (SeqCode)]
MGKIKDFKSGIKAALPIVLGYLPIGMAYGILARNSGLDILETVLMSIFVFAGSSQLIAVEMIAANSAALAIIMMTFLVNLRHFLMSASLSLHFKKSDKKFLPFLGFIITDESFAVGMASISEYEHKDFFYLGLGITAYFSWVLSSYLGAAIGNIIPVADIPALDFVLPAMFIVLLVMQISKRLDILVAIISAILSLLFVYYLPANWNIILATIIAATCGVFLEKRKTNKEVNLREGIGSE